MSVYTTELRCICENYAGLSGGFDSVDKIISTAIPKLFSFDFPIFDENYRSVLCTKIIRHYYTREISEETVGLWKLRLQTKLNEIMPYYNKLYLSEQLKFNPLQDADYSVTHTGNESGKSETEASKDAVQCVTGHSNATTKITGDKDSQENSSSTFDQTIDEIGNSTSDSESKASKNRSFTEDTTIAKDGNKNTTGSADGSKSISSSTDVSTETSSKSDTARTISKSETDKYSDTPQGSLSNLMNDKYLTNARLKNGSETSNENTVASGNTTSNTVFKEQDTDHSSTSTHETSNEDETHHSSASESISDNASSSSNSDTSKEITTHSNTVNSATAKENSSSLQNTAADSNSDTNANESSSSTTNMSSTNEYINHFAGKYPGKSYSQLLLEFRDTLLNIDVQIINELNHLFFNLW